MAIDWGGAGQGALGGAATGAAIGSVIPGIGTVTGGVLGGLAGGAMGLFGGKKGKKDKIIEPYPGYLALGGDVTNLVRSRLGKAGEPYPGSFSVEQPDIEKETEDYISNRIKTAGAIQKSMKEESDRAYQARKARQAESFDEERKKTQDMYNRLGVATSTPGLQAQSEISKSQRLAEEDLAAQQAQNELSYNLAAENLINAIFGTTATQGQALGASQRAANRYTTGMNYSDWLRAYNEPYQWATLGSGLLGSPQPIYQTGGLGAGQQLLDVGSSLLPYLMMMK
jgi:hypothetical protein